MYIAGKYAGSSEKTLEWRDSYGIQHDSASRGVASPTSASRNDRRQGEGDTREIGPYHGDSSCATRSEGFSRRLPRGWRRGLKRFRWETQQGVNGSRHTRWRCPERFVRGEKKKRPRVGEDGASKHVCVHVRTYTIKRRVSLCVNGDTCARARNSEFATAYHCNSTTARVWSLCSQKLGLPRSSSSTVAPSLLPLYFCKVPRYFL